MAKQDKIEPLYRVAFGLAEHRFNRFSANVPGNTPLESLTNPALWVNVSNSIKSGDEIRVLADDDSFVALLHVTAAIGNQIRTKMVYHCELEHVDYDLTAQDSSGYKVENRGSKSKWCIIRLETGEVIKDEIATQAKALKELEDLERALAA